MASPTNQIRNTKAKDFWRIKNTRNPSWKHGFDSIQQYRKIDQIEMKISTDSNYTTIKYIPTNNIDTLERGGIKSELSPQQEVTPDIYQCY